jgi:hypothetical protein
MIMGLEARKLDLFQRLLNIKRENVLKKLEDILDDELVVAHSTSGKPLTKSEYINSVKESEKDIEGGNYFTHDQVLEQISKW